MIDVIRASALDGYCDLFGELGGDPAAILADSHLRPDLLGSKEAFIPYRSMARVLERAAIELKCPDFALRLAGRQSIHTLGPIALIARHSPTLREALGGIAEHFHNYTPALRLSLDDYTGEQARYSFEILVPGISSPVQTYQLILGAALGTFRLLMGAGFRPMLVSVPHARPDRADLYEKFFDCRVQFDSGYAGVLFPSAGLDVHRPSHDPHVHEYVTRFLDAEFPAGEDFVAQVRHLIDRTLATGHASIRTTAAHLGMHTRTLQRSLATHDETFETLLDDVRREKAFAYLTQSALPLSRIAAMLGYSEQSSLSRASIRWFGTSPRTVRNAGRTANPGSNGQAAP